jgi:MFS family permease
MSLTWPVASVAAGRLLLRVGARPLVLVGTVLIVLGTILLVPLNAANSLLLAAIACGVTGAGMGFSSITLLVIIQGAVEWRRRAVATGLVQFSRTIGVAVGVGVMGGVLTAFVGAASSAILDPVARASVSPAAAAAARTSLAAGLDVTYWLMVVAAVLACGLTIRSMPDVSLGHEIRTDAGTGARAAAP